MILFYFFRFWATDSHFLRSSARRAASRSISCINSICPIWPSFAYKQTQLSFFFFIKMFSQSKYRSWIRFINDRSIACYFHNEFIFGQMPTKTNLISIDSNWSFRNSRYSLIWLRSSSSLESVELELFMDPSNCTTSSIFDWNLRKSTSSFLFIVFDWIIVFPFLSYDN